MIPSDYVRWSMMVVLWSLCTCSHGGENGQGLCLFSEEEKNSYLSLVVFAAYFSNFQGSEFQALYSRCRVCLSKS